MKLLTAAEAAFGEKAYFDAKVIPSVAYTDLEVAWVGITEDEAKGIAIAIEKGVFQWNLSLLFMIIFLRFAYLRDNSSIPMRISIPSKISLSVCSKCRCTRRCSSSA